MPPVQRYAFPLLTVSVLLLATACWSPGQSTPVPQMSGTGQACGVLRDITGLYHGCANSADTYLQVTNTSGDDGYIIIVTYQNAEPAPQIESDGSDDGLVTTSVLGAAAVGNFLATFQQTGDGRAYLTSGQTLIVHSSGKGPLREKIEPDYDATGTSLLLNQLVSAALEEQLDGDAKLGNSFSKCVNFLRKELNQEKKAEPEPSGILSDYERFTDSKEGFTGCKEVLEGDEAEKAEHPSLGETLWNAGKHFIEHELPAIFDRLQELDPLAGE